MQTPLFQRSLAEFVATFALVWMGCGAIVVNDAMGGAITHVGIAIVFGLVVTTMIYATGDISGAHLNPAVTLTFAVIGRLRWRDVLPYILAQCLAAIAASGVLAMMFPEHPTLGSALTTGPMERGIATEFLLTFFLMFVITAVSTGAKEKCITAGLAIGGTVAMEAMVGGPITGASMNPARSLGPMLVSGQVEQLWMYLLIPTIGAIAGGLIYLVIRCGPGILFDRKCCAQCPDIPEKQPSESHE